VVVELPESVVEGDQRILGEGILTRDVAKIQERGESFDNIDGNEAF